MPQSLSRVLIHGVFSTKNRVSNLEERFLPDLHKYLGGVLRENGCQPVCMGGVEDHVHLLFGLTRPHTIAKTFEHLKTSSSKWVKLQAPALEEFHWQGGYGTFSIGESDIDRIVRYISNQKEHHCHRSFQEEYRELLAEAGIEYDERYVWD